MSRKLQVIMDGVEVRIGICGNKAKHHKGCYGTRALVILSKRSYSLLHQRSSHRIDQVIANAKSSTHVRSPNAEGSSPDTVPSTQSAAPTDSWNH